MNQQNKNKETPLIMETPPMRINLCVEDHQVDKSDPVYRLEKGIDNIAKSIDTVLKKAGVK